MVTKTFSFSTTRSFSYIKFSFLAFFLFPFQKCTSPRYKSTQIYNYYNSEYRIPIYSSLLSFRIRSFSPFPLCYHRTTLLSHNKQYISKWTTAETGKGYTAYHPCQSHRPKTVDIDTFHVSALVRLFLLPRLRVSVCYCPFAHVY